MRFYRGRYSLAVATGAIFGALSRFYLSHIFGAEHGFLATFLVNLTGCMLIAYIFTLALEGIRLLSPELRLMTTTGFCGAYTTFSTYALETKNLWDQGATTTAVLYFISSMVGGMVCIRLGVTLARLGN